MDVNKIVIFPSLPWG